MVRIKARQHEPVEHAAASRAATRKQNVPLRAKPALFALMNASFCGASIRRSVAGGRRASLSKSNANCGPKLTSRLVEGQPCSWSSSAPLCLASTRSGLANWVQLSTLQTTRESAQTVWWPTCIRAAGSRALLGRKPGCASTIQIVPTRALETLQVLAYRDRPDHLGMRSLRFMKMKPGTGRLRPR